MYSIGPFLLKELSTFLIYISFFIFFNLNSYFLANSKLITNPVILLSNNISTVTSFCVLIISNPIFTVTSLNRFPFKLHLYVLSITLLQSIANLMLKEPNQRLLDSCPLLNYSCFPGN